MVLCRMFVVVAISFAGIAKATASEFEIDGKTFQLPDGFTLEVAAESPLTERPICVDFDDAGNLYVAESSGTNDNVQIQLAEKPHSILRLTDTDGDGKFDQRTVFADKMMFPEGCEWHEGSLYVAAPPQIWKLTDADGDGVAEQREIWFDGETLTGCANDLHGPYTGPDGLLYWCKGAFAEQQHERPSGDSLITRAAHIFRHDPVAGFVEPILTGGMDNPVEVAFTRDGEPILTCTFLQRPAGGNRDGLIHAVYGGVYGKQNGVLEGHPRTGDLMPPLVHLGPAAPAGLLRLEGSDWGHEETLLSCAFNLHKVFRHVLRPAGATYAPETDDFLVCDDVDFHPTDVIEDADGSLLIIDTGGWYKLCCPTSQLHKPDIRGAIYRVRRTESAPVTDPRGTKLNWNDVAAEDLISRLTDDRFAVRNRAVAELAKRAPVAVPLLQQVLQSESSPDAKRLAVWTLTRIDQPAARQTIRESLTKLNDATTLRAAIRSAGLWRDTAAAESIRKNLATKDPHTARVAAEALSRIGSTDDVPALLRLAARAQDDRFLFHAATYALIQIADPDATKRGLASESISTVRASLLALGQMQNSMLSTEVLVSYLDQPVLREDVLLLLEQRTDASAALSRYLNARFQQPIASPEERSEVATLAARFAGTADIEQLLADQVLEATHADARMAALEAMVRSQKNILPNRWSVAIRRQLRSTDPNTVALAVDAVSSAREIKNDDLKKELAEVGKASNFPPLLRLNALRLATQDRSVDTGTLDFLLAQLESEAGVAQHLLAADAIAQADLNPKQLQKIAELAGRLGPMELDRLLPLFAEATDKQVGMALVKSLGESSVTADLLPDRLRLAFAKFEPSVIDAAKPLLEKPQLDASERNARIEDLLVDIASGDVRRGQAVFHSTKAACASCHAVGFVGGRVGPDLTRIGQIRTERDLMEAVLYPSASFVRSYEPVVVVTTDGFVHSGVPQDERPDMLTLTTAPEKSVSIPRDEIEELRPGTVSIMPAGLEKQLSRQDLLDLIVFLKAAR